MQTYGKRPPLPELLAILERHKLTDQWQRDDGKGIPYGATWLRKRRWDDVLEVTGMPALNGTNGHGNGTPGKYGTTDAMRLAARGEMGRHPELEAKALEIQQRISDERKRQEAARGN